MQELIDELAAKANLSPEQAAKAIEIIKDFVKTKFPMFEGAIENVFASSTTGAAAADPLDAVKDALGGMFK